MGEVNLSKRILAALVLFTTGAVASAGPASVRVSQPNFQSPRPLDDQTKNTVIKDYLQSWQVMANALEQNRPDLIDGAFIGSAKADLVSTIQQQTAIGIRTRYHDRSHDLQLLFYSPEGLSIELADNVDYDVEVLNRGKLETTQRVHVRYIAVLTPSEVRWLVRVFQAEAV